MKILVLGDIHGRTIWKDIIEKENPDKIVFLGDYVSSHDNITEDEQISNLKDILKYKEDNMDNVILLRGNHDDQHLGYYWAECSGYFPIVAQYMQSISSRFLNLTQWIYIYHNILFSHAGITETWCNSLKEIYSIEDINTLPPSEYFGFTPDNIYDYYGDSITQPCTWIRPNALCKDNVHIWDQVIGHTPVKKITNISEHSLNGENIWLCDALGVKEYLVIEDNKFIPSKID